MSTLGVILLLTLVAAWLTAAATAVRSVSRIWLRHWVEQAMAGASETDLHVEQPKRWLFAAGAGIAATVFAMGATIGARDSLAGAGVELAEALVLLVVLGQFVPRAIARRWAAPLVPVLMPVVRVLAGLATPLFSVARLAARPAPGEAEPEPDERESLEELLREGELEGVGAPAESAIISGVVEFGEKLAIEVMTLRDAIVAVERTMPAAEIASTVARSKYSRLPVYERDLDHVVGLVHSFDILADPEHPAEHLRRVAFARSATPCNELMRSMLREHVHLAIIQGALGETLGLVTLEDLVEELVGDISDEHDEPHSVTA